MTAEGILSTIFALFPLVVTVALIGVLVALAARIARAPGTSAARLAVVALALALIGSLCFVMWPLWLGSGGSVSVSIDPSTGRTFSSSEQHLTVTWFPNIRQYGAAVLLIGLVPVALAAAPVVWHWLRLPNPRALRLASSAGLVAWLVFGGLAALSWWSWSYPATVTMMVAASRRT